MTTKKPKKVPAWVSLVKTEISERLSSHEDRKKFKKDFSQAIAGKNNANFNQLKREYLSWLLIDPTYGIARLVHTTLPQYTFVTSVGIALQNNTREKSFQAVPDLFFDEIYNEFEYYSEDLKHVVSATHLASETAIVPTIWNILQIGSNEARKVQASVLAVKLVEMLVAL